MPRRAGGAHRALGGTWIGWSDGLSMLMEIDANADGRITGGGDVVGTASALDVNPDTLNHLEIEGVLWLVAALASGLLLSRDAGHTWDRPLAGLVSDVAVDPSDPLRIVAIRDDEVVESTDGGRTLRARLTLPNRSGSLDLGDNGSLWVAPTWGPRQVPGAFRSAGPGGPFRFHPYGGWEGEQLISWDILEVPWSGTVLVANEIGDHPVAYDSPLLDPRRRRHLGRDLHGELDLAGYRLAADTVGRLIYNLLEGPGLWISAPPQAGGLA